MVSSHKVLLSRALAQKEKELKILYDVVRKVGSLDLQEVLAEIVTIATKLTHADSCLVYVLDANRKELILRASKNPHKRVLGQITMRFGEGITGWVAKNQKPLAIAEKAFTDSRFKFFRSLPEDRYEAFLSVPIINKRGVVGVINVQHRKKHAHTNNEINLLVAIGKLVGGAVENAHLVEESLALKDALETRKVLEKAKGILVKQMKIAEDEAYRRIQKKSMDMRKSIREIAEAIMVSDAVAKNGA